MTISIPKFGDGFILRNFTASDLQPLADIEYDQDVKRYLAIPLRARSEFLRTSPVNMRGWAIEVLPDNVLAGRASISKTSVRGVGELEIVIGKLFWRKRMGRKVTQMLVRAAFEELDAIALIAVVHPKHQACISLLESFGFAYSRANEERENHWQNGHLVYELDRAAYNSALQPTSG